MENDKVRVVLSLKGRKWASPSPLINDEASLSMLPETGCRRDFTLEVQFDSRIALFSSRFHRRVGMDTNRQSKQWIIDLCHCKSIFKRESVLWGIGCMLWGTTPFSGFHPHRNSNLPRRSARRCASRESVLFLPLFFSPSRAATYGLLFLCVFVVWTHYLLSPLLFSSASHLSVLFCPIPFSSPSPVYHPLVAEPRHWFCSIDRGGW